MLEFKAIRSFGLVLALGLLIGATADHALNSLEMRALSAKQADRKVRSDLLSILRPIGPIVRGNRRQVGDVWMHTKAAATQYQTLCRATRSLCSTRRASGAATWRNGRCGHIS